MGVYQSEVLTLIYLNIIRYFHFDKKITCDRKESKNGKETQRK